MIDNYQNFCKKEDKASPEDVFRRLNELGIEYETFEHEPVFRVGEADYLKDIIEGGHTKNLFLKSKKKALYLVTALEDTLIDLKKLSANLKEGRFSFASSERLWNMLGVKAGAVCPFALINDKDAQVNVILDKAMMEHEWVNYHPLVNTMSTKLRPSDLLKFIESCGHNPKIMDMKIVTPDK